MMVSWIKVITCAGSLAAASALQLKVNAGGDYSGSQQNEILSQKAEVGSSFLQFNLHRTEMAESSATSFVALQQKGCAYCFFGLLFCVVFVLFMMSVSCPQGKVAHLGYCGDKHNATAYLRTKPNNPNNVLAYNQTLK